MGGAISYAVSPALPAGLTLDTSGAAPVLRGTPTAAQIATTHTVTATESGGTAQTATLAFDITVEAAPAVTAGIAGPDAVDEGGTATYTVTLSGSPSAAVAVAWAVTHGGSGGSATPTDADDFGGTLPSGSLDFAAGATGNGLTQTFTVTTADDTADEPDTETFTVTLTTGAAADVLTIDPAAGSAETAITDNDALRLSFGGAATRSVAEEAGTLDLPVTLSGSPSEEVSVTVTAVSGTDPAVPAATRPQDYTVMGDDDDDGEITLTFPANASGDDLTQTVTINIVDDTVVDAGETFSVRLTDPPGDAVALGTPSTVTVTIADNDVPVPASLRVEVDPPAVVGDGAAESDVTVTLLDNAGAPLTASGGGVVLTVDGVARIKTTLQDTILQQMGANDNGDGTYSATVQHSAVTTPVTITVTARVVDDNGDPLDPSVTGTARVVFAPVLTFAGTQDALRFTAGTAITPVTLPAATGGAGGTISYALTGDARAPLPDGLVFDATTRVLSGTPTGEQTATNYTLTATEEGGTAQTATQTFLITVGAAAPTVRFTPASIDALSVNEGAARWNCR